MSLITIQQLYARTQTRNVSRQSLKSFTYCVTSRNAIGTARLPRPNTSRHLHASVPCSKNMAKIKMRQQEYAESVGVRTKGPRYIHGPTVIGLKVVVQAMQQIAEPVHPRDLFDYIHENGLGNEFMLPPARPPPSKMGKNGLLKPQAPEPSHPEHVVRSYKYMKAVLIDALESHGRIQKVHLKSPFDPANPPDSNKVHIKDDEVHEWRWELIPPKAGKTAWEEKESIHMTMPDRLWLENMKQLQVDEDAAASFARSIGGNKATEPNFARIPENYRPPLQQLRGQSVSTNDPIERTRSILAFRDRQKMYYGEESANLEHGNRLATRWREVVKRRANPPMSSRADEDSRSYWKDPNHMQQREVHRSMFNTKPFMSNYNPDLFKDGAKPGLNKHEPEFRQSRQGKNDIPIALRDPRARGFGFNYGLPKQKRLLEAANARGYDQPEWTVQPLQDFSHLSRRRQRTREEQNLEMARGFNTEDRYARRMAAEARRPAAQPVASDESLVA